jgi:hypothetical protein
MNSCVAGWDLKLFTAKPTSTEGNMRYTEIELTEAEKRECGKPGSSSYAYYERGRRARKYIDTYLKCDNKGGRQLGRCYYSGLLVATRVDGGAIQPEDIEALKAIDRGQIQRHKLLNEKEVEIYWEVDSSD